MKLVALPALLAFFLLDSALVNAQGNLATFPATPLASKHFAYPTGLVSDRLPCNPKMMMLSRKDAALPSRLRTTHTRNADGVQHLQLNNGEPELVMPDLVPQRPRW